MADKKKKGKGQGCGQTCDGTGKQKKTGCCGNGNCCGQQKTAGNGMKKRDGSCRKDPAAKAPVKKDAKKEDN
jgi:hypothetical protein